ncbi:MAG: hypothetical protein ACO1RX_06840 [Candidatus Sericytochromatia bacterium]
MAINPNKPVQPSSEANPFSKMNNTLKTAAEAVADQIQDTDGDKTTLADVKAAASELSPAEGLALAAGTVMTGGALPVISLLGEAAVEGARAEKKAVGKELKAAGKEIEKTGSKINEAIKERYSNPPEKKLIDGLQKETQKIGHKIEEFVDDLKDGRVLRDAKKDVSRFVRDHLTHQTPTEKMQNQLSDAVEDIGDAAADLVDDIQDGRLGDKVRDAFDQ